MRSRIFICIIADKRDQGKKPGRDGANYLNALTKTNEEGIISLRDPNTHTHRVIIDRTDCEIAGYCYFVRNRKNCVGDAG